MAGRGDERRARVLDAALEVIAERGLSETRMSDISQRAGMSAGHVLYYFRTKDLVLMEALRRVEERMHDEAAVELAALAPGPDRLRRLFELNVPDGVADPGWTLWLEAWTLAPHDETIRSLIAELEARWVRLLADVVHSGVEAGAFTCRDEEATVRRLYAAMNGLSIQVVTAAGGLDRASALKALTGLAASELGARVPRRRRSKTG